MMACEVLWGPRDAERVREMVQEAVQGPCPCMQGKICPLAPRAWGQIEQPPLAS